MFNKEIRNEAKAKGVFLYEIAEKLNKSEATMTRLMRREVTEETKRRILVAINEIAITKTAHSEGTP